MYVYESKSHFLKEIGGNIEIWTEIFSDPKLSKKVVVSRDVLNLSKYTIETKFSVKKLKKLYLDFKIIRKIRRVKKHKKTLKLKKTALLKKAKNDVLNSN